MDDKLNVTKNILRVHILTLNKFRAHLEEEYIINKGIERVRGGLFYLRENFKATQNRAFSTGMRISKEKSVRSLNFENGPSINIPH